MALRTSIWKNRLTRRVLFPDTCTCCPDCIAARAKQSAKPTKKAMELDAMKQRVYANFHAYRIAPYPVNRVCLFWGDALMTARAHFEQTGTPCTIYAIGISGDEMPVFDMPFDDDGEASYQIPPLGLPHARGMVGGMCATPSPTLRLIPPYIPDWIADCTKDWNEFKKLDGILASTFPRRNAST